MYVHIDIDMKYSATLTCQCTYVLGLEMVFSSPRQLDLSSQASQAISQRMSLDIAVWCGLIGCLRLRVEVQRKLFQGVVERA